MGSHRDIDDAIDRAVRDIMSVEPRAGLRGRVLDRLDRPAAGWLVLPRLAGAAAIVGMVTISFLLIRPASQPDVPPAAASRSRAEPISPSGASLPAVPPSTVPQPAGPARRAAARDSAPPRERPAPPRMPERPLRPQFPARGAVAAASMPGEPTVAPESLEPVERLPLPAGAPPIAIRTIQIEPLTIEPIVIAPIPPPR